MFNKIIKRGQRKGSKQELIEPPNPNPDAAPSVTVNHASRLAAAPSAATQPVTVPNSGVVEVLPLLKDVPVTDRHVLFIKKLQICCFTFDFSESMKNAREKEIKRQTLIELVDLVQSGSWKMNEIIQEEMVKMISINLFRCLPPASHENTGALGGEGEDEDTYLDPSWPHLQIVYELLLRYVVSSDTDTKIAKRYMDHMFVLKLLDLFDSEDPREREYLKTILHRIYGKFMVHRPCIRRAINNIFYRFIFETERHSGIGELLEILGSIINGFALPMKEEHKLFLVRALIPLHKPKCINSYHQQLSYCITQFVEKDFKLSDVVIKGILRYWPVTNCGKEVLFLGELEEVLEVAERALFWWNNEHIVSLIAENRHVILPIIFEAIEKNLRGHWNQVIHGLTANVHRMFQEMDVELFEECRREYAERESRAGELEQQRALTWKRLEKVAAQAGGGEDMVMVN